MGDKLGLGSEVRELKIGQSFTNPKSTGFHAIRYDFKPASVDLNKIATVEVGNSNQVTLTVPPSDGSGSSQTVFKGSQRPFTKECVLIIDKVTGEITLEKLSANIQVKKTRTESTLKPQLHPSGGERNQNAERSSSSSTSSSLMNNARPATPPIGQRMSNKTKVTSGSRRPDRQIIHLVPKHSPLHASPNYPSPGHLKSPKRDNRETPVSNEVVHNSQSTLASLPMIGIDDYQDVVPSQPSISSSNNGSSSNHNQSAVHVEKSPTIHVSDTENGVEEMSDTSSSSSSSDSDSENESHNSTVLYKNSVSSNNSTNGHTNGLSSSTNNNSSSTAKLPSLPTHLLNEDLRLSESGSDSDD